MNKEYSTIIIGGGVGGLMAARHISNSLLIESKKQIGESPVRTGEGISHKALEMLRIKPDKKWISCEINSILRVAPNGKAFGSRKKGPYAYIVDRLAFEKFLAEEAKAEIITDAIVTDLEFKKGYWEVKTSQGGIYKAKYLIGADGSNSIVRRKVFKEEMKLMPGLQYLIKLKNSFVADKAKIYLDNEKYFQGYAWFFPKNNGMANAGVCCERDIQKSFDYFMKEIVRPEYGDYELIENRSGVIPRSGVCQHVYKNNVFIIGDAAGLTDPIFKGGMSQAMLSGKIAAECIIKNKPEAYERRIKSIPFADSRLVAASKKLYSLNNKTLNELAEVLEDKGGSELLSLKNIFKLLLTKKNLRKEFFKVLYFFYIWEKNKDYLW